MKKILLGVLIVAALSACSSSEEKEIDIPTQVQTLNETIEVNTNTLTDIKSKNDEVKARLEKTQQEATMMIEQIKKVKAFEETGATVTEIYKGLHLTLPGDTSFKTGKSDLNEEIKTILDPIAKSLAAYPEMDATIKGHADITGTEKFNQKLSEDRAMAVSDYLVSKGVDSSRIDTVGVGSSEPIDDNDTEDGKRANRRVDLKITY